MSKSIGVVNELLVHIYNDILALEQRTMQCGRFKDLSVTEMHTIDAIGVNALKSMSEVAGELSITVGTLTTAINNLVKKGYVERKRIEQDRRVVQIGLTESGILAYKIHQRFHHEMVRQTIKGLNEEQESILIQSLEQLNIFFKSRYDLHSAENGGRQNE